MESGRSPPPLVVGGSGHAGDPPPGHTQRPITASVQHTTYNCSDNGSIDNTKKIITIAGSKYLHDDLVQLILPCLLKVLLLPRNKITLLDQNIGALHNMKHLLAQAPVRTPNHHNLQQPS